ncbi:MAG TPA: HEAT repeat domain-containing protein [Candidatus Binatia bacterium]|nr:HEAT repeat domain-containing protein [Candidatus Binatia bacterium]
MTVWLAALLLLVLGLAVVIIVRTRTSRREQVTFSPTTWGSEDAVTGEPKPIPPRWPRRVGLDPDLVDEATRASVIESLTVLDDAWAIGILAQAYEEERDAALRIRILEELRNAATPDARPTLERASRSADPSERSLAYEALAAIGALDVVERGLDDPCLPVAQTACWGLMHNGGRDRVTIYLRQASPERAAAFRVVIDAIELR